MTSNLFTRPDLSVTSADLEAEGAILDPSIYGPYIWWGVIDTEWRRPINRWSRGATNVLRDWFASGRSPVPSWGVLADCLQVLFNYRYAAEGYGVEPETVPPIPLRVLNTYREPGEKPTYPTDQVLWLEPNEVGGWTLLLPSEH